ncbi:hypothetical protein KIN20_008092 [Parelaphostrongylus tenuis]|uniref:Tyrosine-protein kinase n=1 Tax=Parelaphostrongylus tenuis TaxID=148309 RepID=A0AAD5M499_PARTN|nr:hypothetical protein KIN20_008092 [Parelaphostrongylus tenuis]
MPGDNNNLDNSLFGERSLAEGSAGTTSLKSQHSASDFDVGPGDAWLQSKDFYHGHLPREDIPPLLLRNGDFLVRISETKIKGKKSKVGERASSRVISVLVNPRNNDELVPLEKRTSLIKNIVIMQKNKKWWIDPNNQFETLPALFESYATKPLVIEKETIFLKRGVGLCRWEFRHENVQVGRLLGKGAYGEVRKGTVLRKGGKIVNVAVKTLTMTNMMTREVIREIMKEVRIMRCLHHTNVVGLVGVVLIDHPLYILLEYVSGIALDVYLKRKHAKITKDERLAMTIGVATGMDYIHKANILHRDLAARNCLYDRNNTVKISDFGLSRPGATYKMKTAQKMPIKWMAPESIQTYTFTQKTDVYTFGVLIYEIFAGIGPYDDMKNTIVKKLIVEGKVNKFPPNTPEVIVQFVNEKLWCKDPDKRPNFASIKEQLETLANLDADKREGVDEQKAGDVTFAVSDTI